MEIFKMGEEVAKRGWLVLTFVLSLCAATVEAQLVVGNNAALRNGPIATTNFPTGPTVSFVPDGAMVAAPGIRNGRGVVVQCDRVYYTHLRDDTGTFLLGPTDFIHAAPFNGGLGGPDNPAWALPNPRPGCGVQDLASHGDSIYALTGYLFPAVCPNGLQVFKWSLVTNGPWSAPVTITGLASTFSPLSDGFTILETNGVVTFLINSSDASCTYSQFNSTNGLLIPNTTFTVPSGILGGCTGIDTADSNVPTHLVFVSHQNSISTHTLNASGFSSIINSSVPGFPPWSVVEDISLVRDNCPLNNCPLTQGYWKTHSRFWPVTSLILGGRTYPAATLLTLLGTSPQGDTSLILAHQLIAALLNIANGSDPTPIAAALTAANSELAAVGPLPAGVQASTAAGQAMTATAAILDSYNNGLLTRGCTEHLPGTGPAQP